MVAFHDDHASGWTCLDRKHHPLGNENHTIDFCETKITFTVELVEVNANL